MSDRLDQDEFVVEDELDEKEPEPMFDVGEDDEGGEEDDTVVLKKEEYEKLQREGNTTEQLTTAITSLNNTLAPKQTQTVQEPFAMAPINAPPEDGDDTFEDDLLERGKGAKAVDKRIDKALKPVREQMQMQVNAMELRAVLAEREDLKPYRNEIKQTIAGASSENKAKPGIVAAAVQYVENQHRDEIMAAQVDRLVEQKLAEREKQNGGGSAQQVDFSEGLGDAPSGGGKKPSKVRISASDKARYQERARVKGMHWVDYVNDIVIPARKAGKKI